MNNREKNGLIIGVSMAALLAFQEGTEHLSDTLQQQDVDRLEQQGDIVALSPKYGNMQRLSDVSQGQDSDKKIEIHTTLGYDKNNAGWICSSFNIKTDTTISSPQWQISNGISGSDEKIAFPKNSCTQVTVGETPAEPQVQTRPSLMI